MKALLRVDPDDPTTATGVVLELEDVRMVATWTRDSNRAPSWKFALLDIEKLTQDAMGAARWESFGTITNAESDQQLQWLYALGEHAAKQFIRERS
jgi:hypothetical protein